MTAGSVLVVGGAGFIGSHTAKALCRGGFLPVVFDNLSHGHDWAVRWGPLVVADILDAAALDQAFRQHRPRAVLNLAAHSQMGFSEVHPLESYRTNVAGTIQLLDAMRRHGCDRLVFSSTCAVYGIPASVPVREDAPTVPVTVYGRSKLWCEQILQDAERTHGIRWISLRYFNAAGADPDGDVGETHDPETHLVPVALEAAAGLRPSVQVFGTDYDTPDGTCVRDFVHVTDLAEAHTLALRWLLDGGPSGPFNLGSGTGCSVLDVLRAVERVTGATVPVDVAGRRPGDAPVLLADTTRAERELGWRPARSAIDTQIADGWRWLQACRSHAAPAAPRASCAGATDRGKADRGKADRGKADRGKADRGKAGRSGPGHAADAVAIPLPGPPVREQDR